MLKVEIVKVNALSKTTNREADYVAEEKPLNIFLNRMRYATLFCSPLRLRELVVGHLLSEGIADSIEELEKICLKDDGTTCSIRLKSSIELKKRLKLLRRSSSILSAHGGRSLHQLSARLRIDSRLTVKAHTILNCANHLNSDARVFRKTGGVHVASICDSDGTIEAFAEDVSRYNAVDKAIGIASLNKVDFSTCFLALSGRLTGDIVLKAARTGLPIVASLAAAVDTGIVVAKDMELTLVGFVRGRRMNIYSFPERILV